jgi:LemA protein
MAYNNGREQFPATVIAGAFGFFPAEPWRIEDPAERAAPQVRFGK